MTREEAIKNLRFVRNALNDDMEIVKAYDMAIKALEHPEQNVIAVVPCGDAISRQAVLEKAINVPIAKVVTEDTVLYRKIVFADDIENLPSVTPKPETVTEFADRCKECGKLKREAEYKPRGDSISREETLTAFSDYVGSGMSMNDFDALWDIVAKMPAVKESKTEKFAKWVATEIFDDMWEYNKDAFAEIACRKLEKLGIVRAKGDEWELVDPQESEEG